MSRVGYLFCLLALVCLPGFSQTSFQNFQIIDVDKGLSQNSVYALYQDKQGFLWIGTADGLNRYDGKQLKVFKAPVNLNEPSNSNLIRGNIVEDKSGNIWYTSENGLYMFDKRSKSIIKKHGISRNKLQGSDYLLVFIDSSELIWMMSWANGFASFNPKTGEFINTPMSFKIDIYKWIHQNFSMEKENVWFAMYPNDGIYKFNTTTRTFGQEFEGNDFRFVKFQKGGYYHVSRKEVQFYDSATSRISVLNLGEIDVNEIRDLKQDDFGRLWIITYHSGLWYYRIRNERLVNVSFENLSSSFVELTKLMIDRTGNLWVGTDGAGAVRVDLKEQPIKLLTSKDLYLKDLFVKSMVEDSLGNLWIFSLNNPLVIYDLKIKSRVLKPILKEVNKNRLLSLVMDNEGNIWIQNEKSIFVLDPDENMIEYSNIFYKYYPTTAINKVMRHPNGTFAVATTSGTFSVRKKPDGQLEYYHGMLGTAFEETKDGSVWVGTKNYGLYNAKWKPDGTYDIQRNLFTELDINDIHVDEADDKILWLSTDKGLIQFNGETNQHQLLSESSGIANSYVYGVLEDSKNNLWCSTNGGIVRFDKARNHFTNYTVKDGLQNNEFNTNAFHKGHSGNLYFGGVKGLNWFKPEDIYADSIPAEAKITEITVNDQSMLESFSQNLKLELPYNKNDFSFHFSIFDYSKPEGNKVRYQLTGWDKKQQTSYDLVASYHNVLPGPYTFVFSAATSNNRWSKEQRIEVVIHPPFWETWWFYTVVILVFVSIVALVAGLIVRQRYKLQIVELENQNTLERERRRISMEMHDDIGANLTRIALMSEAAKYKHEKEESLDQIAETSRQVVSSMSEIIWSLNPDNKTFDQLMSYLRDQLHNVLEPSGIDYQIELPLQEEFILSNSVKRNVILLLKEAVNNAIKHSRASEIKISGKICDQNLQLDVTDNGVGLEKEEGTKGNGLKNMRTRCAEVGGKICFVSERGKGTSVKIRIPITEKAYH